MTDRRPRPRAFRLDDGGVTYDDPSGPAAAKAEVRSETAAIPDRTRSDPLDEGEREIEAAQSAGLARRWRPSLTTLIWTGLCGLVSLGLALWVDNLVEGLWAKAQGLGWIGLFFAALLLVGVVGLATREFVAL